MADATTKFTACWSSRDMLISSEFPSSITSKWQNLATRSVIECPFDFRQFTFRHLLGLRVQATCSMWSTGLINWSTILGLIWPDWLSATFSVQAGVVLTFTTTKLAVQIDHTLSARWFGVRQPKRSSCCRNIRNLPFCSTVQLLYITEVHAQYYHVHRFRFFW